MNGKPVDVERNISLKKLYQQPTLRVYGSVQDITRTGFNSGVVNNDTRGSMFDARTH